MQRLTVRFGEVHVEGLDALCAATGLNRSAMLRRLVEAAVATGVNVGAPKRQRMTREDVRDALEERARAGSAPAARQLRDMLAEDEVTAEVERLNAMTRSTPHIA